MNTRQKGLSNVREVKKILEGMECKVEGPTYGVAFFDGGMKPIHRDLFGIADLVAWHPDHKLRLHQVTDLGNKARHITEIRKLGIPCWVWCKVPRQGYRVFEVVESGEVIEAEHRWGKV